LLARNARFIAKVQTQLSKSEAKAQAERLTSDLNYKMIPNNATSYYVYILLCHTFITYPARLFVVFWSEDGNVKTIQLHEFQLK